MGCVSSSGSKFSLIRPFGLRSSRKGWPPGTCGGFRPTLSALKAIRDAIKLNPQNINLKQILLRELLPTNKKPVFSKEINKLVNDILVLEPNNVDGLFFSGFAAYNKGEKKKAITYWDLLLKQLPKDSLMSKEINKRVRLLQD